MAGGELHDIVDIEKVVVKSVNIREKLEDESLWGRSAPDKAYVVTYSLPIAVSKEWQYMFQRPDPRSGVVHTVSFAFSDDGKEISATLESEPAPELLLVLKKYAERANTRWQEYRETALQNVSEEERILKRLKGEK